MHDNIADKSLTGLFTLIICLCIFSIIKSLSGYHTASEEYNSINEKYLPADYSGPPSDNETDLSECASTDSGGTDFERLYEINPDLVCILNIPSLNLMYPVVQGTDNEEYLTHTFEGNKNPAGCLFLDYENDLSCTDKNILIYGHNMKDGSMFGSLKKILDPGFDKAGTRAYVITEDGTQSYKLEKAEVVNIDEYKIPENKAGRMILYTCWANDKRYRLLVTFRRDEVSDHNTEFAPCSASSVEKPSASSEPMR